MFHDYAQRRPWARIVYTVMDEIVYEHSPVDRSAFQVAERDPPPADGGIVAIVSVELLRRLLKGMAGLYIGTTENTTPILVLGIDFHH
jgi:hypothetical protein